MRRKEGSLKGERKGKEEVREAEEGGESALSLIIIGLAVGDGVGLLLGGTCVFGGWAKDCGVNVEVTAEMESIKDHGSGCIILTVQHLTDAFIQSDGEMWTTVSSYIIKAGEGRRGSS